MFVSPEFGSIFFSRPAPLRLRRKVWNQARVRGPCPQGVSLFVCRATPLLPLSLLDRKKAIATPRPRQACTSRTKRSAKVVIFSRWVEEILHHPHTQPFQSNCDSPRSPNSMLKGCTWCKIFVTQTLPAETDAAQQYYNGSARVNKTTV